MLCYRFNIKRTAHSNPILSIILFIFICFDSMTFNFVYSYWFLYRYSTKIAEKAPIPLILHIYLFKFFFIDFCNFVRFFACSHIVYIVFRRIQKTVSFIEVKLVGSTQKSCYVRVMCARVFTPYLTISLVARRYTERNNPSFHHWALILVFVWQ